MTNIPAGYQLSISTWENDYDNYKTETLNGLTSEDVQFYICFLNYFKRKGFGNETVDSETIGIEERIAITEAYNQYPPSSPELLERVQSSLADWKDNPNESHDWITDLIGFWNDGEYYRVIEKIDVHYVPQVIEDVTQQFRPLGCL